MITTPHFLFLTMLQSFFFETKRNFNHANSLARSAITKVTSDDTNNVIFHFCHLFYIEKQSSKLHTFEERQLQISGHSERLPSEALERACLRFQFSASVIQEKWNVPNFKDRENSNSYPNTYSGPYSNLCSNP